MSLWQASSLSKRPLKDTEPTPYSNLQWRLSITLDFYQIKKRHLAFESVKFNVEPIWSSIAYFPWENL